MRLRESSLNEVETGIPVLFDPFLYTTELPLRADLYPLGFAFEFSTNSQHVVQAATEGWGGFPRMFEAPPFEVRVAVANDDESPCPSGFTLRAQRHLLAMISDAQNFAVLDMAGRFAFCWISSATARNQQWFRYFYIDTIIHLMLWRSHLTRIHASCVARNRRGVLLCGDSGAGKSCLAYACARRGWTFLSDEATSLVRGSGERIALGKPWQMHFRDTAVEVLPELNGRLAAPNFVGKMTIEVQTAGLPGIATGFRCRAEAVVFLNRDGSAPARLAPLPKEEGWRRLERDLPLFELPVHEEYKACLRHLLDAGVYELRYGDLDCAVAELESLLGEQT